MNEREFEASVTAYALSELDESERAAIEALLAAHPELAEEVEALRTLAAELTSALRSEAAVGSTFGAAQRTNRAAILDAAATVDTLGQGTAPDGAMMAGVVGAVARPQRSGRLPWTAPRFALAAAAALIAFVAFHDLVYLPGMSRLVIRMEDLSTSSGQQESNSTAGRNLMGAPMPPPWFFGRQGQAGSSCDNCYQMDPASNRAPGNRPAAQATPDLAPAIAAQVTAIALRTRATVPPKVAKTGGGGLEGGPVLPAAAPPVDHDTLMGASPSLPERSAPGRFPLRPTYPTYAPYPPYSQPTPLPDFNTEAYAPVEDNSFTRVSDEPLSTFSIDVDTASYANVRRYLSQGKLPPPDAVRIEELVNYFSYDYAPPVGDSPFAAGVEVADAPWAPSHRLVRIGLQGRQVDADRRPAANLVFLIDVSGSMDEPAKLPLVKTALKMLAEGLRRDDRVAIVVYAGAAGLVLPSTLGSERGAILAAIDELNAGGSTNGGEGIRLAYDVARQSFVRGGVNRVLLLTDGDFNVGVTNQGELIRLIQDEARSGISLTTLGFGFGNLKDSTLEQLADKGNGNYGYVDSPAEARKLLVDQLLGTLVTIAKDVKIQIEFNPEKVAGYRLIGYENRILAAADFNDDTKDAGEIGSGHTVTALYEIVPAGQSLPGVPPPVDPLRYGGSVPPAGGLSTESSADRGVSVGGQGAGGSSGSTGGATTSAGGDSVTADDFDRTDHLGELLFLKLRYKAPDGDASQLATFPVRDDGKRSASASADFQFACAVAAFGMLLRDSPYRGDASFDLVERLAQRGLARDPSGMRREFLGIVQEARRLVAEAGLDVQRYRPIFP